MCKGKKSPESQLGKGHKVRDVGLLGETPKLLKPGRMHKVVQSHHWLQIVSAIAGKGVEEQHSATQ